MSFYNTTAYAGGLPPTSTAGATGAASTTTASAASSSGYQPPHKRQRVSDDSSNGAKIAAALVSPSETEANGESSGDKNANNAGTYPNMALSLQKDQSWGMLGDVDSFGGLGPMPSMNAVLEKRASSQFSISSLLPSSSTMGLQHPTSATTTTTVTNELNANNGQQPQYADGSGGNQKYMDATTGEYMYPDNVRPMTFVDKQSLVQKITLLPSQYLRGLMDVISKYQPETVRQIDDDGYAFDLGQMNENTVWAISDYVKDSMVELDGYIRSLSSVGIPGADGQSAAGADNSTTSQTGLGRHQSSNELLNNPKMAGVAQNESQTKFLEQVDMYSKPKITKSRVKPSKKHECETCKKQFRGRSELQNHIRTHTKEKPLACSHAGCNKRYAHSSNLRAHERTHLGIKPYSCHYDGCGKSFAHSVSLKEHIWMHAGFQPYVCPYEGCEKKFTQVSNFARHKKTHEKETRSENEHSIESDN